MTWWSGLGFGSPFWGALGLPFLAGLVALYTIRSKPQTRVLPSLALWRRVLKKKRPNAFLSRYRNSLFFLLQLATLLLLTAALAKPFLASDTSGDVVLVVDVSASMGALDGRFEAARDVARGILDDLDEGARCLVVAAGSAARPRGDFADRAAARAEVDALVVEESRGLAGPDLLASLAALRTDATGVVHVVSDDYTPEALSPGLPGARVVFHMVGETGENVAVTRLDVTPRGTSFQVAALVRNYADLEAEVEVDLHAAGAPRSAKEVVPPKGRERLVLFKDARPRDGVLGVKLRVIRGPRDRLPVDDAAYSAPRRGAVRVLVVAERGTELERALELNGAVGVDRIAPGGFRARVPRLEEYDLVVSDGFFAPELEDRRLLLFHGPRVTPFSTGGTLEAPELTALDATHPVMRYLSLGDVRFDRAHPLDKLEGGRALLSSATGPLAVAVELPAVRQVLCAFELSATDLPRRIAFPIFLTNAVRWLLANDSKLRGNFRVGQPIRVRGGKPVKVTDPAGKTREYPPGDGAVTVLAPFTRTGIYRLARGADVPLAYPVNLLAPTESAIAPAATGTLELGRADAEGGDGKGASALWRILVMAALGLMVLEWLLLARRGGAS